MLPRQKLTDNHKIKTLEYCNDILLKKTLNNKDFVKILWSHEAVFTIAGV